MHGTDVTLAHISRRYEELNRLAFKLWNRAVFWVFVSEWLAVTAASMIAGYAIWTLMVKRRLYREVSATRIRPGTC